MDDKKFRYLVEEMMDRQAAYFKDRKQSDLIESKKLEKQVRAALRDFNDAEHATMPNQVTMDFDRL